MTTRNRSRIRYYQGQPLLARDLQDEAAYEAGMNSLHVTAMHNTWGVAVGLEVGLSQDRRAVIIGPGMAYDRCGQPIINPAALTIDVPRPQPPTQGKPVIWWYDLVIRHDQDLASEASGAVDCRREGFAAERLAWRWAHAGQAEEHDQPAPDLAAGVRLGDEVPLARIVVDPGGYALSIDLSARRSAQAIVRPHIASGTVFVEAEIPTNALHWQTTIDTSAGGFSSARPRYFVRLTEHPLRLWQSTTAGATGLEGLTYPQVLRHLHGPFINIRNPRRTSFRLEVRFAVSDQLQTSLAHLIAMPAKLPLKVSWHGLEPTGGCQPPVPEIFFLPIYFMPIEFNLNMILLNQGGSG
jgi:hypothetical protein